MYNTDRKDGESLEHYYRRLAKVADQRLVRLEALRHEEHFHNVEVFSYKKAMYDIRSWSGKDATRFNTKPPETEEELIQKINDIKGFINAPTSSKTGIINAYKQSAKTMNSNYGTNFTWEDMANFYEREHNLVWDKTIGYKTALYTIGIIQKNKAKIKEALEESKAHNKDIRIVHNKREIKEDDNNIYLMLNYDNEKVTDDDIMKALNEDGVKLSDIGL